MKAAVFKVAGGCSLLLTIIVTERSLRFVIFGCYVRVTLSKRFQILCTRLPNYTIGASLFARHSMR